MEEKYWVVDIASKQRGEALTWKQLLYWADTSIRDYMWGKDPYGTNRWGYFPKVKIPSQVDVNNFFNLFGHNPNDGLYTDGRWKQNSHWEMVQQKDGQGCLTSTWEKKLFFDDWVWIEPTFKPKKWMVVDSFDRVIPSSTIKDAYRTYESCELDKPPKSHRTKWKFRRYSYCDHSWEFRRDPVPGIRHYKNGYWHKYRGKHGHTNQELKQYHRDIIEQKEVFKEYGTTFRIHRTWMDLDPWNHGYHRGTKGKGWKRSRKDKQWMKHGWKAVYKEPR
jgi:hypothetical protein